MHLDRFAVSVTTVNEVKTRNEASKLLSENLVKDFKNKRINCVVKWDAVPGID